MMTSLAMADPNAQDARLGRLRAFRNRPERDDSSAFIAEQFKRDIEKPFKQLKGLNEIWPEMVPADLVAHTRLMGFRSGVLKVAVNDSARLYELDRLLRGGLQKQIVSAFKKGSLRNIRLLLESQEATDDGK